jgi:hypothetical protein
VDSDEAGELPRGLPAEQKLAAKQREDDAHRNRLVEWVVQILMHYLQQINALCGTDKKSSVKEEFVLTKAKKASNLDELVEFIKLPKFDVSKMKAPQEGPLSDATVQQLRNLVTRIAMAYRENPFHNFDVRMILCILRSLLPLGL